MLMAKAVTPLKMKEMAKKFSPKQLAHYNMDKVDTRAPAIFVWDTETEQSVALVNVEEFQKEFNVVKQIDRYLVVERIA